jgi:hypothetical protein
MATVAAVEGEIERHGESLPHDAGHGARYAQGKIILRKEDHQALQSLYAFNISPNVAWGIPELTRELKIEHWDPDRGLAIRFGGQIVTDQVSCAFFPVG